MLELSEMGCKDFASFSEEQQQDTSVLVHWLSLGKVKTNILMELLQPSLDHPPPPPPTHSDCEPILWVRWK